MLKPPAPALHKTTRTEITPLFSAAKLVLDETPKATAPFGGLASFISFLGQIGLAAQVDDAVIDVGNVFRRLRENARLPLEQRRPALRVVLDASVEIRRSIVFATLIIARVFTPLSFLSGAAGRLLKPLGEAYLAGLLPSLVVAVTATSALCSSLLPGSRAADADRYRHHGHHGGRRNRGRDYFWFDAGVSVSRGCYACSDSVVTGWASPLSAAMTACQARMAHLTRAGYL